MRQKIIFMGTPDFALPCLNRLVTDGYNVAGVICQPDRPSGRGGKLTPPPVKRLAEELGIPVFQPDNLREGHGAAILKELAPALGVAVAYGRLLPADMLAAPEFGCVNVHGSLLPKLRGAAPIQRAIINGETVTGVTTMHMAAGLDTGDIIFARETAILPDETAGELFARLASTGAELLSQTVGAIFDGTAPSCPQEDALASWAPPLSKEMALVDFGKEAAALAGLINGLSPSPGARIITGGRTLKLLRARLTEGCGAPGQLLDAGRLVIACGEGALELLEVAPEGKKRMTGAEFARGRRLKAGEKL